MCQGTHLCILAHNFLEDTPLNVDMVAFRSVFCYHPVPLLDYRKNVRENSVSKELKSILSNLDQNEYILQDGDSFTTKLIMVCGRSEKENLSKSDMNEISRSLANKRLLSLANSYLENLRQEARIVFK